MALSWRRRTLGRLTEIDWAHWLLHATQRVDPYLVWADLSGGAGFAASPDGPDQGIDRTWPFIIELSRPDVTAQVSASLACAAPGPDVPWIFGLISIPGVYKEATEGTDSSWSIKGKFITAQVRRCDVKHLLSSPDIARAQLGLPRIRQVEERALPTGGRLAAGKAPRVVIGLIDDGFAFAHPKLLDHEGLPRVRYLWDQDPGREAPMYRAHWSLPADLGYGAELVWHRLEALVLSYPATDDDPWAPYRPAAYGRWRLDPQSHSSAPIDADGRCLPFPTMQGSSHGDSVATLAAGFPPLHRGQDSLLPSFLTPDPRPPVAARACLRSALLTGRTDPRSRGDRASELDSADQWHLVCVQLPVRTVADTSGGSLAVHVLDGLRYIMERARRLPEVGDPSPDASYRGSTSNPVIVNVSYGALGGGHDGTSILEQAIEEITRSEVHDQDVWVVLAAGNAHHSATHASIDLCPGETGHFSWRIGPDNPLESHLEIWLPDLDITGEPVLEQQLRAISIDVQTPAGQLLPNARMGGAWELRAGGDEDRSLPVAALVYGQRVVQGLHGTMVLLAVAPTRAQEPRRRPALPPSVASHGDWTVSVHWIAAEQGSHPGIAVHAWSERSDLLYGLPRGQQSQVRADEPTGEASEADPEQRAAYRAALLAPEGPRSPHAMRAQFGLSSLAGVSPASPKLVSAEPVRGDAVVVGAHRIVDGEVSSSSSGGPSRHADRRAQMAALASRGALPSSHRLHPDASAPGDLSASVPGLRALGWQGASQARISATSAAAAQVTRTIANLRYAWSISPGDLRYASLPLKAQEAFVEAGGGSALPDESPQRATLTPRADDTFRRGRTRPR